MTKLGQNKLTHQTLWYCFTTFIAICGHWLIFLLFGWIYSHSQKTLNYEDDFKNLKLQLQWPWDLTIVQCKQTHFIKIMSSKSICIQHPIYLIIVFLFHCFLVITVFLFATDWLNKFLRWEEIDTLQGISRYISSSADNYWGF